MHRGKPPCRRARQVVRAFGLQFAYRVRSRVLQFIQGRLLGLIGLNQLRDPLHRPIGQARRLLVADNRSRRRIGPNPSRVPADGSTSVGRSLVSVGPEHTDVEIVIGVGPERIIRIGPERIVDEIPIGIRPEQTAEPADHDDRAAVPPPPSAIAVPPVPAGKTAVKTCARQCPCAGCRGEGIVAQKRRSPNASHRAGH